MDTQIDQTIEYVTKSIVQARSGRKCVDGRYLPDQACGQIARPGGDSGYVMALMAVNRKRKLGLTPEECLSAVYNSVTKNKGKFFMHTDHKCDPNSHTHNGLIGCGHLAKAASRTRSRRYDVASKDVKTMVHYARFLCNVSADIEMVNLEGDHQEKGVLVVRSDKYTVLADNPKLARMYFVYDQDRDLEFMRELVDSLKIPGVTFEEMKKESDLQLNQTLQNIAGGLPVYEIAFLNESEPVVTYMSSVPMHSFPQRFQIFQRIPHFFPQRLPKLAKN